MEIAEAARFFVRQVLLVSGADHYRVLGLSRSATESTIRRHYHLLVGLFHPDRSAENSDRDAISTARINAAYEVLRDPANRRRYDRKLKVVADTTYAVPDHFVSFQPSVQVPALSKGRAAGRWSYRKIWGLSALGLVGATLVASIFLLIQAENKPVLRSNPRSAGRVDPEPVFPRRVETASGTPAGHGTSETARAGHKEVSDGNVSVPVVLDQRSRATAETPQEDTN